MRKVTLSYSRGAAIGAAALIWLSSAAPAPAQGQPTWNPVHSPSPSIEGVAVDPVDERTLYVWGAQTGLYISRDEGNNWTQSFTAPVANVVADPKTGRVYAAVYYNGTSQGQVFLSANQGRNWSLIGTFPDPIYSLLISHDGSIFAAPRNTTVASGVYKSSNGGASWNHYLFPTSFLQIICWDIQEDTQSGIIYVGTEIANHPQPYHPPFFRSTDGGVTWQDITGTLPWHVVAIQIVNQVVYALTEGAGLYKSPDHGTTWNNVSVPFFLTLFADPLRPGVLYGGNNTCGGGQGGAFLSTDGGGLTWSPFGLDAVAVSRYSVNKQDTKLYAAGYGTGILVTELSQQPQLNISKVHGESFTQGQVNAAYTVTVSNGLAGGPTAGTVTVAETVPPGLTLVSMAGTGWNCSNNACTRDDSLSFGLSYPPITVTVNVAADAPPQVTNQVSVSGGGSATATASDVTTVAALPPPVEPVLNSPSDGATGALLAPALAWSASGFAVTYDVYFGTSSVPPLVASTTGASYAPGTLDPDTTYYWQIVARNAAGAASSAISSFATGVAAVGLRFVPVTPCRLVDTRNPAGPFGGPALADDSSRSFTIPQSGCGIPAAAQAYSLNVTVVPKGPLPYLTLWPTGQPQPFVSTLNSFGGIVVANAAIVPAGTDGAVSVYATEATNVILDIDGYFDTSSGPTSYLFHPVTPCRAADTRGATGPFGGPSMSGGERRDFPIPQGPCPVPASAQAYSLNATVVPGGYLGYLTTWPTGLTQPNVSTLNSWTGKVAANAALVPAGTNESISVFVSDPTNVILDINGYFGQPGSAGALFFYPVTPCRVADTRNPNGDFGGPKMAAQTARSFPIPASACGIPTTAAAYSMNVTVVPDGLLSYLTAWPAGSPQPNVSTLNSFDGSVVANAAIVPAGTNGAISIYVTQPTQVILDINGYFAP